MTSYVTRSNDGFVKSFSLEAFDASRHCDEEDGLNAWVGKDHELIFPWPS